MSSEATARLAILSKTDTFNQLLEEILSVNMGINKNRAYTTQTTSLTSEIICQIL